jgi:hypothetical protein
MGQSRDPAFTTSVLSRPLAEHIEKAPEALADTIWRGPACGGPSKLRASGRPAPRERLTLPLLASYGAKLAGLCGVP